MAHTPDAPPTAPSADAAGPAPRRGFLAAGWAKFSDNAIPSLVVAIIAGLVMFSLDQTNDRITRVEDRITRLEANIDTRFTKLEESQQQIALTLATLVAEFSAFQEHIDVRFDAVEIRLAKLEENQQGLGNP